MAVTATPASESITNADFNSYTRLAYASCRLIHNSVDYSRHTSNCVRLQSCILLLAQLLKEADKAVFGPHEEDPDFP